MPRPREFDEPTVLEAAMRWFWNRGFKQTSMRDLAGEIGITSASLYNAFGDNAAAAILKSGDDLRPRPVRERGGGLSDSGD